MIKQELLNDAKRCAEILCPQVNWVIIEGRVCCKKGEYENLFFWNPLMDSRDFEKLTKAVFEHPRVINEEKYCITIRADRNPYQLNKLELRLDSDGELCCCESEVFACDNLTDFLIRALVVLEDG